MISQTKHYSVTIQTKALNKGIVFILFTSILKGFQFPVFVFLCLFLFLFLFVCLFVCLVHNA